MVLSDEWPQDCCADPTSYWPTINSTLNNVSVSGGGGGDRDTKITSFKLENEIDTWLRMESKEIGWVSSSSFFKRLNL